MKQLFIGLVVLNLVYLLFQQVTAVDVGSAAPVRAVTSVNSGSAKPVVPTASAAIEAETIVLPEPVPESVAQVVLKTDQAAAATESKDASLDRSSAVAQASSSCVIAGPFRSEQEGQALVTQLANAGIEATLQPRDTSILPDYMVYVGPESSNAQARALEAKFKARQMDSHVIAAGNLQNALSLGVFSRGALAKSLLEQLESEGYQARISELTRNRRGYQVRTRLPRLIRAKLVEADTPMIDCPQTIAQR